MSAVCLSFCPRTISSGHGTAGRRRGRVAALVVSMLGWLSAGAAPVCEIQVVEQDSGWPVPLVELRTTHQVRFVTDNAGVIAFDLPECMGRETWFNVIGHGYEVPRDGLGSRGVRLTPQPGRTLKIEVTRTIVAKRLGRLTGAGLFAESQKAGHEREWRDAGGFGSDSVQTAVHRGKLFWAWGDTLMPDYPLGIFHMTSATTEISPLKSFEPPVRLQFDFFQDDRARLRGVAVMPGAGPTWVNGYTSLRDRHGEARLVGTYAKVKPPLEVYESGLCVWNDGAEKFEQLRVVWSKTPTTPKPPARPEGHAVFWRDAAGREWVLYGDPFPALRCPATFEAWQDAASWEVLTPQAQVISAADGAGIKPHRGSIAWNPWRKRWVAIFTQAFGKPSAFGEVWYTEAETPTGPWGKGVKILSHENYTFYNPRLHPEFTAAGSPILIFEGTYSREFADHAAPTPRYDYNQILYRLDLDDPALAPARNP